MAIELKVDWIQAHRYWDELSEQCPRPILSKSGDPVENDVLLRYWIQENFGVEFVRETAWTSQCRIRFHDESRATLFLLTQDVKS